MATSKRRALEESLDKAKSWSKHWEWKDREGKEKMKGTEEERDMAMEEAQVAQLVFITAGEAKAWTEEARCKAEAETTRLEVEQTSLLLEIGAAKDEVGMNKKAMEEGYQKALEVIFAYSYRCCAFKNNICVKPRKNSIFLKKGKTVISVENRRFSRSRMTKWIAPLNSSREN